MALNAAQRKLLREITSAGGTVIDDPRIRRIADRAAAQSGLVESNLRNLNYGDADSKGWRQERASLYPNPTNVKASAKRFYKEFLEHYDPGEKSYEVAAQVQRPAAQYRGRYKDVAKQAAGALKQIGSSGGGGSSSSSGGSRKSSGSTDQTTTTVTGAGFDPGPGASALAQLAQAQARPQAPVSMPSPPQFAAQAAMPGGYQAPSAAPIQQPQSNLTELLANISNSGGSIPQVDVKTSTKAGGGTSSRQSSGGSRSGGGSVDGDRNPIRGRKGKLIGVPHSGTHTLGNWQSDNAIDLGVPENTVLESVANGKVVKVKGGYSGGSSRFDGYQVTIQGEDGRRYFYTHLSKTHLKPGQRIKAGQAVGRSGSANGVPHLHLGVERGDARKYR